MYYLVLPWKVHPPSVYRSQGRRYSTSRRAAPGERCLTRGGLCLASMSTSEKVDSILQRLLAARESARHTAHSRTSPCAPPRPPPCVATATSPRWRGMATCARRVCAPCGCGRLDRSEHTSHPPRGRLDRSEHTSPSTPASLLAEKPGTTVNLTADELTWLIDESTYLFANQVGIRALISGRSAADHPLTTR